MLKFLMFFFILIHLFNFYSWSIFIFQIMLMMILMMFMKLMNFTFLMDSFFLIDKMSMMMIFLTLWIFSLSVMSSNLIFYSKSFNLYLFNMFLLLWILLMVFLTNNLIYFFFFFESSLLPTFLLILGWGMKKERLQSGMYMLFYTLFGSLPMLLSFVFIFKDNFCYSFFLIKEFNTFFMLNMFMFLGFLMKLPMFFFHSWLPKAHVEAPVSGSMILAGVLLKLGGYGLIRFFIMLKSLNLFFLNIMFSISLIGGLMSGFMCFYQTDMKSLVAYSSVSHMSLIICGLVSYNWWGLTGVVMMMISHGFCSSALFCLINFNYERLSSRSLIFNKGFINLNPSMSMWWFLFCSFNMSCPPSLNLISELTLFNSFFSWSSMSYILIFCIPFITAVYSIGLFSMTQHGFSKKINLSSMFNMREFLIMILHFCPLIVSFLKLDVFLT